MVAIDDIRDRDSFKAWLEETSQPRQACVALAARAAARVLPLVWADAVTSAKYSALPFLRANLIASVVGLAPSGMLTEAEHANARRAVAVADAAVADAALAVGDLAAFAATNAALAAAAALAADAALAAYAAALAAHDAADAADAAWAALRLDCAQLVNGRSLRTSPLFPDVQPSWIANAIQHINNAHPQSFSDVPNVAEIPNAAAIGSKESRDWSFWLDWYQRLLDGREQNWPLLLEIATRDDAFWQGSDDEVNARIAEIAAKYGAPEDEPPGSRSDRTGTATEDSDAVRQLRERLSAVHPALTYSTLSVLEQIAKFREEVRSNNQLSVECPEFRDQLLEFLDRLSSTLDLLLKDLPAPEGEVTEETAQAALTWRERYASALSVESGILFSPETVARISIPTGLILGLGAVGALVGGTLGFPAGLLAGKWLVGEVKPGAAADRIAEMIASNDDGGSS